MGSLSYLALALVALPLAAGDELPQAKVRQYLDQIVEDRSGPLTAGQHGITDKPTARREAHLRWFGEWSPEFRSHMLGLAEQERGRYRHMIPGGGTPALRGEVPSVEMAAAAASGTWVNLGPTKADVIQNGGSSLAKTDSGRPRAILVDPNNAQVIYVCTAGGGVWKTTNGGTNWTPITEALGSLSSGYLAMDPVDSNVLYLGLGDPFDGTGIGLVKSTDGGATWGAVTTLGTSRAIRNIAVHPTNRNVVMVSTNAGLYRSTDAGASYTLVATAPATYACWDVAWAGGDSFVLSAETDPANANGETAGKLFRSTDGGATWVAATGTGATATRISLAVAPSNRQRLYAMASDSAGQLLNLYKSLDGGATWATVTKTGVTDILNGQGWYNHMVMVDRTNPDTVYIGGALYVAKSTNAGSSWAKKSDWLAQNSLPYVHADMHCATQDANGAIYVGSDGGVFKTTDGGTTFTDVMNVGITSHLIYSVGSSLASPNAIIGGFQDNGTRVRSGATSTFNQYVGGDGFGSVMHPVTANTYLGSLYYTRIYKSTNGTTFTSASSGITESNNTSSAPFITRIALGLGDATGNTVYTFVNTKVYKSTNFAGSWTAMGTSGLPTASWTIRNIGSAKSNANVVGLVANASQVFLTSNAGSSWIKAGAIPNSAGYLSSVAFDPTDYNVVYVTSLAADATKNHIWKSSNFGTSWTSVDGTGLPAGAPVNQVVVDPGDRNVLFAATHLGLYRSADGGTSWVRWGSGLPLVNVMDLWVAPDSSKVRVATFGRGFWELQGTVTPTAPSITSHPQSVTVASGATATFNVSAGGSTPLSYQWKKAGSEIAGATTASYTTPATTSTDNNSSFTVVVTNSVGSVTSNAAILTVTSPSAPSITTQPANQSVTAGQTATFSVVASGTGPLSYQWMKGGVNVTGATASSYTTPATTTADNNSSFTVKVSNSAGNVTSNAALLTVLSGPTTYNEVESNNTTSTANVVADTVTKVVGYISSTTDGDYFKLNVGAGRTLKVVMTGPTGTAYDYDLYFYNAAGTQLGAGTGATTSETVSWANTTGANAVVTVFVKRYKGSSTTTPYNLAITR